MKQVCKVIFAAFQAILSPVKFLFIFKRKAFLQVPALVLAIVSLSFASCTKSEVKPSTSSQSSNTGGGGSNPAPTPAPTAPPTSPAIPTSLPIADVVTVGTWKVSSYVEKVETSTKKFSNFTFTFSSNRSLVVKDGGNTITGTWAPAEAIFYYGIPSYGSNPNGFFITLSSGLPLSLLSKNFFVSFKSLSSFTLESINPAEDTHVIFTKQ